MLSPGRLLVQWSSGWSHGGKGLEVGGPPPALTFPEVEDEPFIAAFFFGRLCLSDLRGVCACELTLVSGAGSFGDLVGIEPAWHFRQASLFSCTFAPLSRFRLGHGAG